MYICLILSLIDLIIKPYDKDCDGEHGLHELNLNGDYTERLSS